MADHKTKRFRLSFVNAAEDVPRLVRAYGRACFGEFALVLRPTEHRGVMVRVTKEGAWMWKAGDADAPVLPDTPIAPRDAVALAKAEQRAVPKPGPITLRGQWSGYLHCEDGTPRVEVSRKLAAYGTLRISSSASGWNWTVERAEKWFSTPGTDSGTAMTLAGAIGSGLARGMRLLGEACSTRDSHRRAAMDESYAVDHPVRPAKEGKDPTERLRLREPRRTKAAPPPRVDAPLPLPDAPSTPAGVQRMADEISREAEALSELGDVSWIWRESTALSEAVAWFREADLGDIADDLASHDGAPDQPPEQLLQHLRAHLEGEGLDEATRATANALLGKVEQAFREAPYVLERARRLLRHAARLTETELCRGTERKESAQAIQRAIHAYDEARAAVGAGAMGEARAQVRSLVEWAALAAAKAARACASGQTRLPMRARPAKAPEGAVASASKPNRRRSAAPVEAAAAPKATPPPHEPEVAPEPPRSRRRPKRAASEPETPPLRRRRAPEPEAPTPATTQASPPRQRSTRKAANPEADAEKDKLLLDAFRDAVAAAMSEPETG